MGHAKVGEKWGVPLEVSLHDCEVFDWPELNIELSGDVRGVDVNNLSSTKINLWNHVQVPGLKVLSVVEIDVPCSVEVSVGREVHTHIVAEVLVLEAPLPGIGALESWSLLLHFLEVLVKVEVDELSDNCSSIDSDTYLPET